MLGDIAKSEARSLGVLVVMNLAFSMAGLLDSLPQEH